MVKRIIFILIIAALFCLGLKLTLRAQKVSEEVDIYMDLSRIEEKIDKAIGILQEKSKQEEIFGEISNKLNRVLNNQEKIIAELGVIKIRTAR